MTVSVVVAIVWRLVAIVAVVGIIIGRIRALHTPKKIGGPQTPENPREP